MLTVSGLFTYPVKSLGGFSLDEATLSERGFQYDRRWMLVDNDNHFLTQREYAEMALLQTNITDQFLQINHKIKGDKIDIPLTPETDETAMVQVWSSRCRGQFVSNAADEYFSTMLSVKCRLVYMPDSTNRWVDGRYAFNKEITSFADDFPLLIIGQASLDDLNGRLAEPLLMDRFRPNIVFRGGFAFQEDEMKHFTINNIDFYGVKLCARCPITTIDQQTTAKSKEPLKTLATYRTKNNKVYFGQNLLHKGNGKVRVGDEIQLVVE